MEPRCSGTVRPCVNEVVIRYGHILFITVALHKEIREEGHAAAGAGEERMTGNDKERGKCSCFYTGIFLLHKL